MCDPVIGGMIAMSVLSMGSQQMAANDRAKALNKSNAAFAQQETEKAGALTSDRVRAGRRERARMKVAAAESGLASGSRALSLQEQASYFNQGVDAARIAANAEAAREGSQLRTEAQISGTGVSGLQLAAGIGSAYLMGSAMGSSSPGTGSGLQIAGDNFNFASPITANLT